MKHRKAGAWTGKPMRYLTETELGELLALLVGDTETGTETDAGTDDDPLVVAVRIELSKRRATRPAGIGSW